jgi:hypothetical protein
VTATDPSQLTVVGPGEGRSGFLRSIGVEFKLWRPCPSAFGRRGAVAGGPHLDNHQVARVYDGES